MLVKTAKNLSQLTTSLSNCMPLVSIGLIFFYHAGPSIKAYSRLVERRPALLRDIIEAGGTETRCTAAQWQCLHFAHFCVCHDVCKYVQIIVLYIRNSQKDSVFLLESMRTACQSTDSNEGDGQRLHFVNANFQ